MSFSGSFRGGEWLDGLSIEKKEDGKEQQIKYHEGKKNGRFAATIQGHHYDGDWVNGVPDGQGTQIFHPSG